MIQGIHHITAIASDPQRNLDFYTGVLGLRLVKRTVNFDAPGTYHFYFGDEIGRPGTILTFFPWPGARRGSRGVGQATATSFSVPEGSLGFWLERLRAAGVVTEEPHGRFGHEVLTLLDPDGLQLELIADPEAASLAWAAGPVPGRAAIRGLHGVTLLGREATTTGSFLEGTLGFRRYSEEGRRQRYAVADQGPGRWVDVLAEPHGSSGRIAAGTVHHVAWRVASDQDERAWRESLTRQGAHVSPVMDRRYFRSIYFREPGGVLFEIATDPPGFTFDEEPESLGAELKLPPWLEARRGEIEQQLPDIEFETLAAAGSDS